MAKRCVPLKIALLNMALSSLLSSLLAAVAGEA